MRLRFKLSVPTFLSRTNIFRAALVFVFLLFLGMVFLVSFFIVANFILKEVVIRPVSVSTDQWQERRIENPNVVFRYPKEWEVKEMRVHGPVVAHLQLRENEEQAEIGQHITIFISKEKIEKRLPQGYKEEVTSSREVLIDDITASEVHLEVKTPTSDSYNYTRVEFAKDEFFYELTLGKSEFRDIFTAFLSTFKFSKPEGEESQK